MRAASARDPEQDHRAAPLAVSGLHRSAVALGDRLDDRKTQTRAAGRAGSRCIGPGEGLEGVRQEGRRETLTRVGHADREQSVRAVRLDGDPASRGRSPAPRRMSARSRANSSENENGLVR